MRKNHISDDKGIAPVVIAVIIALVLGLGGAAYMVMKKGAPPTTSGVGAPVAEAPKTVAEQLDGLAIEAPQFEAASASALPGLDATALNVTSPDLPGTGVFKDFSANTSTTYSYALDIPVPAFELTVPKIAAPAPAPSAPPAGESPSGGSGGGSQGQVNAATCAQFSSMPSVQYCSQVPDPNGKTLCEQCKAAGF